jgi:hypothetical protein
MRRSGVRVAVGSCVLAWACSSQPPDRADARLPTGPSSAGSSRLFSLPASPNPAPPADCPLGWGTFDAQCAEGAFQHSADVDEAVRRVIRERPELFVDPTAEHPRVAAAPEAFLDAVNQALREKGYCARLDEFEPLAIHVKKSNVRSELYRPLDSKDIVRFTPGTEVHACQPAATPLGPDIIDDVRVAPFGGTCPDGVKWPGNSAKVLYPGCEASVTATPKTKPTPEFPAGRDVPPHIFTVPGAAQQLSWEWAGDQIRLYDFGEQEFNKFVLAVDDGDEVPPEGFPFEVCVRLAVTGPDRRFCWFGRIVPLSTAR